MSRPVWTWLLIGSTVIAWAGFFIHNVADLPGQTLLSPESLWPTVITLAFLVVALVPRTRLVGVWLLLVWAVLHLVGGGILSVLPIGLFPFTPDQSWQHYAFHGLYTVTQVPLIAVCIAWLVARHRSAKQTAE